MEEKPSPKKFYWFQLIPLGTFLLFTGVIIFVVITANSRKFSGVTGVDASQIQALRHEANAQFAEERKGGARESHHSVP